MSSPEGTRFGELEIRPKERIVLARGQSVALTFREFEILTRLAEHPGWVLSSDQLSDGCAADDFSAESVSVLISRLRHKLSSAGVPEAVETVRGSGYRLHVAEGDASVPADGGRSLRDAFWELDDAVLQAEHAGNERQRAAVVCALERARLDIYAALAERGAGEV